MASFGAVLLVCLTRSALVHGLPARPRLLLTVKMAASGGGGGGSGGDRNWRQRTMEAYGNEAAKAVAPAAERNKEPLLAELRSLLPADAAAGPAAAPLRVLEVASGTGQHAAHFAQHLPHLTFQPTELTDESFASIAAWAHGLPNVDPPLVLDVADAEAWGAVAPSSLGAVLCANMCHISPFAATQGLVAGAARTLAPGGRLLVYGPFTINGGEFTTESNRDFDRALRARDPSWGYRDVEDDMRRLAREHGLELSDVRPMPANNFLLVFDHQPTAQDPPPGQS